MPRKEMPGRGLEPLRISPPDPKSGASANFATLAPAFWILDFRFSIANGDSAVTSVFHFLLSTFLPVVTFPRMKSVVTRLLFLLTALPACALASNSVVNLSHYDMMRPDFVGIRNEGVVGVIHEVTFPRFQRDSKYRDRQSAAIQAGLFWGAYHFGDATDPIRQADHFLNTVASAR